MTLEQRERELVKLMQSGDGGGELLDLYINATGLHPGTYPPVGTFVREHMIPRILSKEFPRLR